MSHLWKKVQDEMVDAKTFTKKTLTLFWFPVKDIKIPVPGPSWASIIAHKDLLDLIIWM